MLPLLQVLLYSLWGECKGLKTVLCGPLLPWLQDAFSFDVCAETEETVEHRAYDISHHSETAALRNKRLMLEYYGSPSCDGQASVINHKNYKQFVQNS